MVIGQNIAVTIDRAIAEVGRTEFTRLSHGMDDLVVRSKVDYALSQLQRLSSGGTYVIGQGPAPSMPDYVTDDPVNDQWLALFYMLWYQPRQILLARDVFGLILDRAKETEALKSRRSVQVFDYGCGTLAGLFGLTIAAHERQLPVDLIETFRVNNYDISGPMMRLGKKLWVDLQRRVQSQHALKNLGAVMAQTHSSFDKVRELRPGRRFSETTQRPSETFRCLTGLHCLYDENVPIVKAELASLMQENDPDVMVMSVIGSSNELLIRRASPRAIGTMDCLDSRYIDDYAKQLTGFRRWLRRQLIGTNSPNWELYYLNREVPWSYGLASFAYLTGA